MQASRMRTVLAVAALATAAPTQAPETRTGSKSPDTKSKEPPAGAPWIRDFAAARQRAMAAGRPIFVYSTKTY